MTVYTLRSMSSIAVSAPEIAHVVARHRAENMSTSSLYWGVGAYTIAFFGLIGLLASLVPWGLGVFSEIPHSIGQEFEGALSLVAGVSSRAHHIQRISSASSSW